VKTFKSTVEQFHPHGVVKTKSACCCVSKFFEAEVFGLTQIAGLLAGLALIKSAGA